MSSGPECWVHCHSCQQCVSSLKVNKVETHASYGGELDPMSALLPAFVCNMCWLSYYVPTVDVSKSNGTREMCR